MSIFTRAYQAPNVGQGKLNNEVKAIFIAWVKLSLQLIRNHYALDYYILGPTGFDRMCGYVCKHAGAWEARLDHYSQNAIGESNYAMAA